MSKREDRLLIKDIIDSIQKIESYVSGIDFDTFSDQVMVQDAVVRNFEIIG